MQAYLEDILEVLEDSLQQLTGDGARALDLRVSDVLDYLFLCMFGAQC